MTWARVDDAWWCHPKVLGLDLDARGLWVSALSWSCQQKTDVVPMQIVYMCGDDGTAAKKLEAAGLWDSHDEGWAIHDWDDYQSDRAKKAAAGRKGGRRSGESRRNKSTDEADDNASSEADEGASGEADRGASGEAGPTRPDPSLPKPKDTSPVEESFDVFWREYPRGNNGKPGGGGPKKPAWQKWRRLTDTERDLCLSAVPNYRAHVESPDGPYAAHATTWLNQERWEQWQTPAEPGRDAPPHMQPCPECGETLGWTGHPQCGVRVEHG